MNLKRNTFLVLVGILIVIGGLFFIYNHNHNNNKNVTSDRNYSENKSSPTSDSKTKDSSKQSEEKSPSSSSEQSGSKANPQSSENSSTTTEKEETSNNGTSSNGDTADQAIDRPEGAWVDTFEKELYETYHVTPSRYKSIGNGLWEVWVKEYDTGENPYVTVDQNSGDFHG